MKTLEQFLYNLRENTIAYYGSLKLEFDKLDDAFMEELTNDYYSDDKPALAALKQWKKEQTKADLEMIRILKSYEDDFYKKVDKEIEAKRKKLISSIEKKAGEIISVQFMNLGVDGELNGVVTGSKNTVSVNTIYAGGYNIQKLHYRTLIKVL